MADYENNDDINQEDNINAFEYEKEFEKELEELENKLKGNKDFENLVTTSLDYYKQLSDIKVDELMMKENERLLKLAYGIYYEEAERSDEERMYVHEGVSCSKCGIKSIIGTRYLCSVCEYFNLCPLCEKLNFYEGEYHDHDFIKIRKKEDLTKLTKYNSNYDFTIHTNGLNENEILINISNKYNFEIENNGKNDWPSKTIIYCIPQVSNYEFKKLEIVGLKKNQKRNITFEFIDKPHFSQYDYCRCVMKIYGIDDQENIINFISPYELHFIRDKNKENNEKNKDNNDANNYNYFNINK